MSRSLLSFVLLLVFTSGCSSLSGLFQRTEKPKEVKEEAVKAPVDNTPKRTTRQSLEDESQFGEQAGSLWVGRGQSSYLFANNNHHFVGDLINITIDGYPKEQIQTKAKVISKLLAEILMEEKEGLNEEQQKLENEQKLYIRQPASVKKEENTGKKKLKRKRSNKQEVKSAEESAKKLAEIKALQKQNQKRLTKLNEEDEEIQKLKGGGEFPIKMVPARVKEVYRNGNYYVRGTKPFMIGRREYRLLIEGMIRPEDYSETGISAEKLLDPTFDIISEKKGL